MYLYNCCYTRNTVFGVSCIACISVIFSVALLFQPDVAADIFKTQFGFKQHDMVPCIISARLRADGLGEVLTKQSLIASDFGSWV